MGPLTAAPAVDIYTFYIRKIIYAKYIAVLTETPAPAAVPVADIQYQPPCCCSRLRRTTTPCPRLVTWEGDRSRWLHWQRHIEQQPRATNLPVIGDIEVELADMGRIFGQNNVASELPRSEPEGKVWNFVELKFCMNSAGGNIVND